MDDADHGLARRQAGQHLLALRALLDVGNEILHHRQSDVCLEQSHAHFAQGVLNVGFGQAGLAAQGFDYAGKAIGEVVEHGGKMSC